MSAKTDPHLVGGWKMDDENSGTTLLAPPANVHDGEERFHNRRAAKSPHSREQLTGGVNLYLVHEPHSRPLGLAGTRGGG